MKKETGITLVALVITIIVLLILAGVTLFLTLGEHGIFQTAESAVKNYTEAQDKEITQLDHFDNEVGNIVGDLGSNNNDEKNKWFLVEKPEEKTWDETKIDSYSDGEGNIIPVPKGFTPIPTKEQQGTAKTGFVIRNNKDGNEFVWVPVAGMNYSYERHDFGFANADYSKYSETLPTDEQDSINTHEGYYIGRYETGIESYASLTESANEEAPSENWTGYVGGKVVIQPGKQVYNYITRDKALEVATNLYNKGKDNVQSKLCSGYAWDTTLKFMEQGGSSYPTNSEGGYYNHSAPSTTGYDTTHPCNIYDIGGNVWEWTTEGAVFARAPYVLRGGGVRGIEKYPAVYRDVGTKNLASNDRGFRITLFM